MAAIQCRDVTFEKIQAVIFDKDGTLVQVESYLRHLGQRRSRLIDAQVPGVQDPLLMAFGLDNETINPAGLLAVGTRYENEIAAAAYVAETGRDWLESFEIVRSAFREADSYLPRKAETTPLCSGVLELLQRLRQAEDLKIGILSSDSTRNVRDFVQTLNLEDYFQMQMGTEIEPAKPDPNLFLEACKTLAVAPESVVVVGDAATDIKMARVAGAAGSIGVTWGWSQRVQLPEADITVNDCEEIVCLV